MGLNSSKSSLNNIDYSLQLSTPNDFYRGLSTISGEFNLNVRQKLRINKEIRIDLVGELIESKKHASRSSKNPSQKNFDNNIFFTYSSQLVTSHENGTARTIKHQNVRYPFRIALGANLPPSCEFRDFSISYYLRIYLDGTLLPNINRKITIAPPQPLQNNIPLPLKVTGSGDVTLNCSLTRMFYSGFDGSEVPISVSIMNPKQKQIKAVTAQLLQTVSLNGHKRDNEILTALIHEIPENTKETQLQAVSNVILPRHLPATFISNENSQAENMPSVSVTYEFRVTVQMKGAMTPNIRLVMPIGIE